MRIPMRDARARQILDLFARKTTRPAVLSDNLKEKYCALADDSGQSSSRREASMLFSTAETSLNMEETEDALQAAQEALAIFKRIEDQTGIKDTTRLLVKVHCMKADLARYAGEGGNVEEMMRLAGDIANEELEGFKTSGYKLGQAAMVLSLAEVNYTNGGKYREDALDRALEARDMYEEAQDTKMQGIAAYLQAQILCTKKNIQKARRAATDAIKLFQDAGDKQQEVEAWYACAVVEMMGGAFADGVRCAKKAVALLKEMGDRKLQVLTLYNLAQWYFEREDAFGGLAVAEEALSISKGLDGESQYEVILKGLITQAYIMGRESKKAVEVATDLAEKCQLDGSKMELARALHNLVFAQTAAEDYAEAISKAEEAVAVCRELSNKVWESAVLEALAEAYMRSNDSEKAKQTALDAVSALRDAGAVTDEAVAQMQVLAKVLFQRGEMEGALEAANEARKLAQKAEERDLEAFALLLVSGLRSVGGKFDQAVKAGKLSAEIYHGEGDVQGEVRALKALSDIYMSVEDPTEALRGLKQAEKLAEEFGDKKLLGEVKHDMATALLMSDKAQEAIKVAMDALKVVRADEDMRSTIKMLYMILDSNTRMLAESADDPKQAKTYKQGCEKAARFAKEAVGLSVKLKDKGLEGQSNRWLAFVNLMAGNLKEFEEPNKTALAIAKESGDKSLEATCLLMSASSFVARMDRGSAVQTLNEANAVAQESGDEQVKADVAAMLEALVGAQAQQDQMQLMPMAMMNQAAMASAAKEEVFVGPDPSSVRQYILGLVQNMTGSSDEIDGDTPLMESGIDSLASVELRTQLQQEFRLNLPSTVMFNYPTISTMTALLVEECTTKKISWGR